MHSASNINDEVIQTKKNKRSKIIPIVVIAAFLIISGLIIAIIIINTHSNNESQDDILNFPSVDCDNPDDAYAIQTCIQEKYNEDDDVNLMVQKYQSAIDKALTAKNYELASSLVNARSVNLIDINQCSIALQLLDQINPDSFDIYNLAIVYAGAIGTSKSCDDIAAETKWSEAYTQLTNRI